MACGAPCVVTDVGDSGLVVGETGMVVPPHDRDALVRSILDLLNEPADDRDRRSKAARHRVESEFSMESLGHRTGEFLASVQERA
jgi:glycosyltransferase involved in cell wall biosynthesis